MTGEREKGRNSLYIVCVRPYKREGKRERERERGSEREGVREK